MSSDNPGQGKLFLPVYVKYKKTQQKLRFLMTKTPLQTISAIMRKLRIKDDPRRWGLFRVNTQMWLPMNPKLAELDIRFLEVFVMSQRKDYLGQRLKAAGMPSKEMEREEERLLRIETPGGTHKTVKYDVNTTPGDVIKNIIKKDPIADWQNYMLFSPQLSINQGESVYLEFHEPIAHYRLPDRAELVLKKMRTRFNVRLLDGHMDVWAEMDCILPRSVPVRDTIEYLYTQMDSKFDLSNREARDTIVKKWGLYLSTPQNKHGIVMLPDRSVDSYSISPDDWCVLKRRPKNKAELLIGSHASVKLAAQTASFLQIHSEPTNATSTFKFPASVTVQQAISKCSKKFDTYGGYGLWYEQGKNNAAGRWLEPERVLATYNIPNMTKLLFRVRKGALLTTPDDDLGEADTSVKRAPALTNAGMVYPEPPAPSGPGPMASALSPTPERRALVTTGSAAAKGGLQQGGDGCTCPKCGATECTPGKFCGQCGTRVPAAAAAAAAAAAPVAAAPTSCPKCNFDTYTHGKFCGNCGFRDMEAAAQRKNSNAAAVGLAAVMTGASGGGGASLASAEGPKKAAPRRGRSRGNSAAALTGRPRTNSTSQELEGVDTPDLSASTLDTGAAAAGGLSGIDEEFADLEAEFDDLEKAFGDIDEMLDFDI